MSDDLYSLFNTELKEKFKEFTQLLDYLADSYFGADADLIRIRNLFREVLDTKKYFSDKNVQIADPIERSYREDFQDSGEMARFMDAQINPLIEMFKFIIELYEENK